MYPHIDCGLYPISDPQYPNKMNTSFRHFLFHYFYFHINHLNCFLK